MKTQVTVRDFTRTEGLENFLITKLEDCVSQFFSRHDNAQLTIKAQEERHRTTNRKPTFSCEVHLKMPGSKTYFQVRRTGANFHECVEGVSNALREMMRRKHRKIMAINSRRADPWAIQTVA